MTAALDAQANLSGRSLTTTVCLKLTIFCTVSTGLSLTDGPRRVPNGDTEMHGSLTPEQLAFYDREGYWSWSNC